MAIQHLQFSYSTPDASRLRSGLASLEQGREILQRERDTMLTRINNQDPSQIANFDEVVIRYGVADYQTGQTVTDAHRTMAQNLYNELNADVSKITTDATVDHVNAALNQLFNYTR